MLPILFFTNGNISHTCRSDMKLTVWCDMIRRSNLRRNNSFRKTTEKVSQWNEIYYSVKSALLGENQNTFKSIRKYPLSCRLVCHTMCQYKYRHFLHSVLSWESPLHSVHWGYFYAKSLCLHRRILLFHHQRCGLKDLNKTKVQKIELEIIFLLSKLTRILIPKTQGILGFVNLFLFCFNFLFVEQMCGSLTAVIVTLTFGSTRGGKWGLLDATPTTSRFFSLIS